MSARIVPESPNTAQQVVLSTSDEAASIQTITGWVSRNGRYWGDDERMARYDGCTHGVCECGAQMSKSYTKCDPCRRVADLERFDAKPRADWDGVTMIYSDACDRYFQCNLELAEFLHDENLTIEDLRLVLCEPNYARPVESDQWCDDLPEDGDLPCELQAALKSLNAVIATLAPLSWSPGRSAATIESIRAAIEPTTEVATGAQP